MTSIMCFFLMAVVVLGSLGTFGVFSAFGNEIQIETGIADGKVEDALPCCHLNDSFDKTSIKLEFLELLYEFPERVQNNKVFALGDPWVMSYERFTDQKYDYDGEKEDNIKKIKCCQKAVYERLKSLDDDNWSVKIARLMTFTNILMVCAVFVGILLTIFFLSDIYKIIKPFVQSGVFKKCCYGLGFIVSAITLLFKYETMIDSKLGFLFIFDTYTPLFGVLVFGITVLCCVADYELFKRVRMEHFVSAFILVFAGVAYYHNNSFIGVLTIWLIFLRLGFMHFSIFGITVIGFTDEHKLVRSMIVAYLLVASYIFIKITNPAAVYNHIQVFETGALFWGTFIGLLALLIASDYNYIKRKHHNNNRKNKEVENCANLNMGESFMKIEFCVLQIVMVLSCIVSMYFGTMMNIQSMMSIGGTFLVLWFLDLERIFLHSFTRYYTLTLFIIFVNLMGIYYYIKSYPNYFIF